MPKRALPIVISILIVTSHFDAILRLQAHGGEADALTALEEIERELRRGEYRAVRRPRPTSSYPKGFRLS
ncbi:MAG: hypothetical protein FGF51_03880 [Candidatus Brockarchaeota archaeon]|nr:hypothetical protein [Candidatus Brockarchaeota archaeon]